MSGPLARVLLIGDTFRDRVVSRVRELVGEDGIEVVGPTRGDGTREGFMASAVRGLEEERPDIALVGFGPQALVRGDDGKMRWVVTSPAAYELDLRDVLDVCVKSCGTQVVFVTAPPIEDGMIDPARGDDDDEEIRLINHRLPSYNRLVMETLPGINVMLCALHEELDRGRPESFECDGVTLSASGLETAAKTVARGIYSVRSEEHTSELQSQA